ncbi:MAG: hypothetical protein AAF959_09405, partial [Cyanobacteria bacterium P01_D01_bin.56]
MPDTIKFGIRTLVPPIGQQVNTGWTGFCGEFSKQLQQQLRQTFPNTNIRVINDRVVNPEHAGHDRYYSLKNPSAEQRHDIQCGPNSLRNSNNDDEIEFAGGGSKYFYSTGIKLLMKRATFEEHFKDLPLFEASQKMRELGIKIAAKNDTTTYDKLYGMNLTVIRADSRADSLDMLYSDDVDAYASDGIIIRALMEEGVEPDNGIPERPAYGENGYVMYPDGQGYIGEESEFYTLVVSRKDENDLYASDLLLAIERILDNQNFMNAQGEILRDYENGRDSSKPEPNHLLEKVLLIIAFMV